MNTDTETFDDYIKNEREAFSKAMNELWLAHNPQERVAIENLLIAYDQMAEKFKNQSSAVSDETECLLSTKANRDRLGQALSSVSSESNVVKADFVYVEATKEDMASVGYDANFAISIRWIASPTGWLKKVPLSSILNGEVKEKDLDSGDKSTIEHPCDAPFKASSSIGQGWHSVNEKLPEVKKKHDEDNGHCYEESDFVLVANEDDYYGQLAALDGDGLWWFFGEAEPTDIVKYWMPIPELSK